MSWICPNCSNSNEDTQTKCFVCGMDKPSSVVETDSGECKIVFSDFEAFTESVKNLFRSKPATTRSGDATESVSRTARTPKPSKSARVKPEKAPKEAKEKKPKKSGLFKSDFAKPWPEHKIKFDTDVIKGKGYVRSEQKNMGGVNGYCFYKEDGSSQFIRVEMVLIQKMAHKV